MSDNDNQEEGAPKHRTVKTKTGTYKITTYPATIEISSSAAALLETVRAESEREKVLQADRKLSGLDNALLIAIAAEPSGPLAVELKLPDLSPAIIKSLADSNLAKNQKCEDRGAGLIDHLKKGGITAAIAYLKSLAMQ